MGPQGGTSETAAHAKQPESTTGGSGQRSAYRPLWNNVISMAGIFIVVLAIILLLTFGLFSMITPTPNPYVDIAGYLIFPSLMVLGLLLTPFGIFIKSWRLHRRDATQKLAFRFPRVDFNDPIQRRAAKFLVVLMLIMLPVVGVSGYHGYHYTDSVDFCARACHSVMEPEATTYEHSSHARVSCAECHIGAGASWFVKSKLSGTRQVFATLRNTYPRPIPPAISNLRPARETCDRCHWPYKFYGAQLAREVNFSADEHNTRGEIDVLLKIGGGDTSSGRAEGIHKHMALEGQIEYIATDDKLQEIPWVQYTDRAGNKHIFRSDGRPSSDARPEGQVRKLDCMDCHNRPAHEFRAPETAVDIYLEVGRIDTTLPFIKREAVTALVQDFPDKETALNNIAVHLTNFYQEQYPEIWQTRRASVNQAIDEVRDIYSKNFFPNMKVDWRTYPDNIGHKDSAGCFRCHSGRHMDQYGRKISHECSVCHTFYNPKAEDGAPGNERVIQEGDFVHPLELEGMHADLMCHQCHTGGLPPQSTCQGCHDKTYGLYAGTLTQLSRFAIAPDPMLDSVDCRSCHDLSEPLTLEALDAQCMDCHDDEEEYEGMLAGWSREVETKRLATEEQLDQLTAWIDAQQARGLVRDEVRNWLEQSRETLELLSEAGALHNHRATIAIHESIARQAAELLRQRAQTAQATPANQEGAQPQHADP